MEEKLECCCEENCECKGKKALLFAGLAVAGVSLIALGTSLILKKKKNNSK